MRNVTLRQLRILSAVTKTGSMAGAARQLHVTPPAITVQMQQLEETAGLPLIERLGEGTTPTGAGEVLLRAANRIEALLAECDQELAQLKGIKGGRVAAGVVSTAKYFAPKALAAFKDAASRRRSAAFGAQPPGDDRGAEGAYARSGHHGTSAGKPRSRKPGAWRASAYYRCRGPPSAGRQGRLR